MKVGIAISSFKSDQDVILLIKRILSESWPNEGIIVVDSLGEGKIKEFISSIKSKKIEYFNFDINLGSAGNLSKRLEYSAQKDWDFVLALNHDALVSRETFEHLIKYDEIPNIGALYPLKYFQSKKFYDYSGTKEIGPWRSFGEKSPTPNKLIPCKWSSSNGALYNLHAVRSGIVPKKELWMGWEDYLFGLDLKKKGYDQFIVTNAICDDSYEFKERRFAFKKLVISSKPSWYHYYRTRNLWLICIHYHPSLLRFTRVIARTFIEFIFIIIGWSETGIRKSIGLQMKGLKDGVKKITGKKVL